MPSAPPAPPERTRALDGAPLIGEKYERGEGLEGEFTCADTMGEAFRFSGWPDTIFIQARTFGAVVELTDEVGKGGRFLTIHAGENFETHYGAHIVRARNLTAGSNALLSIFGKWSERRG